jgi:hypothetical protein
MRLTLGVGLLIIGIALCAFGCYFLALGLFARSADNALINYVLLAAPPIALGLGLFSIGWRTVKETHRAPGGNSPG